MVLGLPGSSTWILKPSCGKYRSSSSGRFATSRPSTSKFARAPNLSWRSHVVSAALTTNQPSPCGARPSPVSTSRASGTADLRAEELVLAQLRAARLAVDGCDRREGRVAGRTAPKHLAAALDAALGNLGLEVLEPAQRGAAPEAERDPVAEYLPPLLAEPFGRLAHVRRLTAVRSTAMRRVVALALVLVVALVGWIGVRDARRGYRSTRGAEVTRFTLHSRLTHRDLHEIVVVPNGGGTGRELLVFLHGRGASPASNLS